MARFPLSPAGRGAAPAIQVRGNTVTKDGCEAAYLVHGVYVSVRDYRTDAALGRLVPAGDGTWDTWTALHPAAPAPSDTLLATGQPFGTAIAAIFQEAGK